MLGRVVSCLAVTRGLRRRATGGVRVLKATALLAYLLVCGHRYTGTAGILCIIVEKRLQVALGGGRVYTNTVGLYRYSCRRAQPVKVASQRQRARSEQVKTRSIDVHSANAAHRGAEWRKLWHMAGAM